MKINRMFWFVCAAAFAVVLWSGTTEVRSVSEFESTPSPLAEESQSTAIDQEEVCGPGTIVNSVNEKPLLLAESDPNNDSYCECTDDDDCTDLCGHYQGICINQVCSGEVPDGICFCYGLADESLAVDMVKD